MMWISRWMWIAIGIAAGGALGCKGDSGPPCSKVAEHVAEVVSKQYPGHVEMMSDTVRKQWVTACEARKLTGKQRQCMLDAKTSEGLSACLPKGQPDEKPPAGGVPVPVPPTPAPGATPPAATPPAATPPAAPAPPPPAATPPAPAAPAPAPAPAK
jgi:hypothetical protein